MLVEGLGERRKDGGEVGRKVKLVGGVKVEDEEAEGGAVLGSLEDLRRWPCRDALENGGEST